ncbi:DNA polymerase III gamma and tau chains [Rickettsia prowazekii str. Rp22]|uniref:DNA polymerase III subunit gamma/tau n=3 Tax=Rickettsia prowazekii TaxID=782 RepID=Q9ZCA1_RICPR|nr:DNA polymerase III gamma and tau chains [Rickettsia prowazekii str. Rp22]AFE49659.1 DNA polymerase III subunits gamma and tau [Rickettsia prowazekii str. Chernikova]AFE50503.1 DNA polymerase III subunits gamma and tau [Rickettsia prowazekii str. Katsinyian]AFE51346.1 DNA polymerase III subunits gamma and tau [Rickettsia prowazekii str. BuV67-CWPP]AFE52184.1 DNA polymerase III subunits gamma and tau [Rickettsia prowazekii str. Dachau]AGJ01463.1 DNA polymerase III subunits gamma and tau [Rick
MRRSDLRSLLLLHKEDRLPLLSAMTKTTSITIIIVLENSSNQYIPFARKYRPSNFTELQGQEVLVKILSYTILNDRLVGGYLLTGIRGIGKTTSARIIAKAVNCSALITENTAIKTCEKCTNCVSFNNHNHPDIIEIDAASKTSIDDIRRIIESAEYKPLQGKHKIFIIDEVHMLSKGAFNALLKTLEEPPPHVIFIFATTEVQKVPSTIISRCQRYDLRRLSFEEIFKLLQYITKQENLIADVEALRIIAHKSEGSARDAVSILDQAASMSAKSGNIISPQIINQMLGLVDTSFILEFIENIISRETEKAINLINKLYYGFSINLETFIKSVADFIAYLNKVKILPNYSLPIYESFNYRTKSILDKISLPHLSILWQIYNKGVTEIKISYNQLIETEMLVIKSIYSTSLPLLNDSNANIMNADNSGIKKIEILDFLEYLYKNNEIDIYYFLLNHTELKKLSDNRLELYSLEVTHKLKKQIEDLLAAFTKEKPEFIVIKEQNKQTLKGQLINKIETSNDFSLIKKHFPNVKITDILLKIKG